MFAYQGFKIWCAFYICNTPQFRQVSFQMLSSHKYLVATVFGNVGLGQRHPMFETPLQHPCQLIT